MSAIATKCHKVVRKLYRNPARDSDDRLSAMIASDAGHSANRFTDLAEADGRGLCAARS